MIFLPMILAVMVDRYQNPKVATFLRLVLLIPAMIPGPLIFVLWKWMYDLYIGPINYFLVDVFHLFTIYNQPQWLGDERLVFPAIAVLAWWWGLGYHTMFYLAGLATIPRDLYDAAKVDGANEWRLFKDITFQRLRPDHPGAGRAPLRHGHRRDRRVPHPRRRRVGSRPPDLHLDRLHAAARVRYRRLASELRRDRRMDRDDR